MKLFDTILFSLSAALLIIGIHQSILHGVENSYFLFMMASGFFLWYTLRKKNRLVQKESKPTEAKSSRQKTKRKQK